jgi:hypothetical protein
VRAREAQGSADVIGKAVKAAVGGFTAALSFVVELTLDIRELLVQTDAAKALVEVSADLLIAVTSKEFTDGVRALVGEPPGDNPLSGVGKPCSRRSRSTSATSPSPTTSPASATSCTACCASSSARCRPRSRAARSSSTRPSSRPASSTTSTSTASGKLRLFQWAYAGTYTVRGLGPKDNAEGLDHPIVRFGTRRVWQTTADKLPKRSLGVRKRDDYEDTVFDFAYDAGEPVEATRTADLAEAHDLLEKLGYVEPAASDKLNFTEVLTKKLRRFQADQRPAITGRLDNDTINRLLNFDFEGQNLRRAKPFDVKDLPAGVDEAQAGPLELTNGDADHPDDEGIEIKTSPAGYTYYVAGTLPCPPPRPPTSRRARAGSPRPTATPRPGSSPSSRAPSRRASSSRTPPAPSATTAARTPRARPPPASTTSPPATPSRGRPAAPAPPGTTPSTRTAARRHPLAPLSMARDRPPAGDQAADPRPRDHRDHQRALALQARGTGPRGRPGPRRPRGLQGRRVHRQRRPPRRRQGRRQALLRLVPEGRRDPRERVARRPAAQEQVPVGDPHRQAPGRRRRQQGRGDRARGPPPGGLRHRPRSSTPSASHHPGDRPRGAEGPAPRRHRRRHLLVPHADGDTHNYECNVKLREQEVELRKVPIATPHIGMVSAPREGDLVSSPTSAATPTARSSSAASTATSNNPPIHAADEWRVESPLKGEASLAIDKDQSIVITAGKNIITIKKDDSVEISGEADLKIEVKGDVNIKCTNAKIDASPATSTSAPAAAASSPPRRTSATSPAPPLIGSITVKAKG